MFRFYFLARNTTNIKKCRKVKWKRLRIAGVPFALHLPLVGLRAKQNGMPANLF